MNTPVLQHLMAAYFHQDFFHDYGGVWEPVDAFVREDPSDTDQLVAEIKAVVKRFDEDELGAYVDNLGAYYVPQPEDGGYRGWLTEIARRVEAAKG